MQVTFTPTQELHLHQHDCQMDGWRVEEVVVLGTKGRQKTHFLCKNIGQIAPCCVSRDSLALKSMPKQFAWLQGSGGIINCFLPGHQLPARRCTCTQRRALLARSGPPRVMPDMNIPHKNLPHSVMHQKVILHRVIHQAIPHRIIHHNNHSSSGHFSHIFRSSSDHFSLNGAMTGM